jgi:hypothetical protein
VARDRLSFTVDHEMTVAEFRELYGLAQRPIYRMERKDSALRAEEPL